MAARHKKRINDESVKHSESHNKAKHHAAAGGEQGNKNVLREARAGGSGGHIAGGASGKLGRKRGGGVGADKSPFSSAAKAE